MSSIRFICQCCRQPLKLSQSLETLGLEITQEPTASTLPAQQEAEETLERGPASKAETDSTSCSTLPGDDDGKMSMDSSSNFILLGEFAAMSMVSNFQKTAGDIFDILTGETDVDHPLCEDCTDKLLEELDTQLILTEVENQNYKHWSRRLHKEELETLQKEVETLQEELEGLELEEMRLVQDLDKVEKNRERVAGDLEAAQAETPMLDRQDEQYWRDYSNLQWQQLELQDELTSRRNQLAHIQMQWDRLQKTNVFSATFEITHDGPVGIINSFRLGCLSTVPVSWNEINMAWGQTALLLHALSNKIGLEFQRYRLFPCGNRSYLKSLTNDTIVLPLFCISGQRNCLDVKFDLAMMAFLDCMQQFKEEAEKGEQGLCLPCKIHVENGLMEDSGSTGELYSIRTRLNTEEQWTKALKLMLINFKCTLAWVSLKYCQ